MAKKKQRQPPPLWSMHPSKHAEVSRLLEEDDLSFTFHSEDDESNCTETYDTSIMGRFKCHNPACSTNKWVSGHVAITIRMYPENEYNARVYHQRCQRCNFVSKPTLDYTYADRVTYRLKKWSGLQLEKPVFTDKKTPPHKSDLCEGCKAGHCLKASQLDVRDQANSSTPLPHLDRRAMAIISKHYFG